MVRRANGQLELRKFQYTGHMSRQPTLGDAGAAQPTIAVVARRAGVSVPTVSKVLNGRSDVSAQTRRRVEAIIHEVGYRPTRRATRIAPLLELAFHELESEWALEIIKGVEGVAAQHDLGLVLSEIRRPTAAYRWLDTVLARRPVGVIAVLSDVDDDAHRQLRSRGIPLVVVDPTGEPSHDTPSVGAANWNGGLAATRHLLELGHRRIGVIAGPEDILCSRARLDGFRAAMDAAGVEVDPALVRFGDFHLDAGVRHGRELLGLADRPTAIFAANDLQALGVYQVARDLRISVPEDLSVVGFDDLPIAHWVSPPLTTVRQPLVQMASAAARLVLQLAAGEAVGQRRLELATELVVRSSTCPPGA
jgi:DNA-binding LacI/PurR family transcriptional regulator